MMAIHLRVCWFGPGVLSWHYRGGGGEVRHGSGVRPGLCYEDDVWGVGLDRVPDVSGVFTKVVHVE